MKSLSDQIIYHPVKYKILFGSNAEEQLQATFKVVKNPNVYGCFDEVEMTIEISSNACGHFTTIFSTLLHEMVHLALYVRGDDDFDQHGVKFMRIKDVYSELYNFDPKAI